jgi:hypothetical protein
MKRIKCLYSYHHSLATRALGERIRNSLSAQSVEILIDPLELADHVEASLRTFAFDAVLFIGEPESWSSKYCQLELETAKHRSAPVFVARLSGDVPDQYRNRLYFEIARLANNEFETQMRHLATAMHERVNFISLIRALDKASYPGESVRAGRDIFTNTRQTVLAEFLEQLAVRYRESTDPQERYWIALAVGKAGTSDAAKLLEQFRASECHPFPKEGISEAEMLLDQEV